MPAMTIDELMLNLPYEFRDYITEDADKYYFDYSVLDTQVDHDGTPGQLELLAAAVPKKTIEDYGSMLRRCGLNMIIATPAIMAFANIIGNRADDFCFLDIGARQSMFHMFPNGKFETTRPIDIGLDSFIHAVAEHFSVSYSTAASYFETNYEDSMRIPACMDIYESLAVEVGRIISFYGFSYPSSSLKQLHYAGIGSLIPPLMETLRAQTSIPLVSVAELLPRCKLPASDVERAIVPIGVALQDEGGAR